MFSLISAMGASVSTASLDSGTAAGTAAQGAGGGGMWILLLVFVLVMYLFMIRPEKKRNKETQDMLKSLKKGDKIVTIGGICGTIAIVRDNSVVVKVDDNARIEFQKNAISRVVNPKPVSEEVKPAEKPVKKTRKQLKEEKKAAEAAAETTAEVSSN